MKKILILLIVLILVTACAPISETDAAGGAAAEDGDAEEGTAAVQEPVAIGIEATIDEATGKASIHYFLDDNDDTFELDGADKDLLIWEIARKYDISLNKVRRTIAFGGEKYTSELWEETGADVVPTESGSYDDTGSSAVDSSDATGDLWFDARIYHSQGYTTVYTYRGDRLVEQFRLDFADRDVVVVDIKNKYGLTMSETRASLKFDGKWYISRESAAVQKLLAKPETEELKALAANLTYLSEKEEGFLRGVSCDLNNSLIKVKFTNIGEEMRFLFADRKPQIPESLRFVVNGKTLYNLDCGKNKTANNTIEPGETQECIKSGVYFIKSRPDFYSNKKDRIYVTAIGLSEFLDFECK